MTPTAAATGGGHRRFVAPARDAVASGCFDHPVFAGMQVFRDLLDGQDWPGVAALDRRLALPDKRLVEQDAALLADGLHYETRIADAGCIATRAENWHDLFNALVWARYPSIKRALNARQCRHIAAMGQAARNRAQAALTQFDESGVIVRVRDPALLAAWDQHDWSGVFVDGAGCWQRGDIAVAAVFGHALMEQALLPGRLLLGKCVVVHGDDDAACIETVARALEGEVLLRDPLELRPLPLMGISGWHARQNADFYGQLAYFRPLRKGRTYPRPVQAIL